jgi:hypothetical protein
MVCEDALGRDYFHVSILIVVKCIVCSKISKKEKLFVPKWDSLEKHVTKKKTKDGQVVMDVKCTYEKYEIQYATMKCLLVMEQLFNLVWFHSIKGS